MDAWNGKVRLSKPVAQIAAGQPHFIARWEATEL